MCAVQNRWMVLRAEGRGSETLRACGAVAYDRAGSPGVTCCVASENPILRLAARVAWSDAPQRIHNQLAPKLAGLHLLCDAAVHCLTKTGGDSQGQGNSYDS